MASAVGPPGSGIILHRLQTLVLDMDFAEVLEYNSKAILKI